MQGPLEYMDMRDEYEEDIVKIDNEIKQAKKQLAELEKKRVVKLSCLAQVQLELQYMNADLLKLLPRS